MIGQTVVPQKSCATGQIIRDSSATFFGLHYRTFYDAVRHLMKSTWCSTMLSLLEILQQDCNTVLFRKWVTNV